MNFAVNPEISCDFVGLLPILYLMAFLLVSFTRKELFLYTLYF